MVGHLVITAVAVGLTAIGLRVTSHIQYVRGYRRRHQLDTGIYGDHSVECASLRRGPSRPPVRFRIDTYTEYTTGLKLDANGKIVFCGELRGGSAAMRTNEAPVLRIPSNATHFEIKVEGDGNLWTADLGYLMDFSPTFKHDFETTQGEVTTHTLALSEFTAHHREGHVLESLQLQDPSTIQYVGLSLQEGAATGNFSIVLHELEFRRKGKPAPRNITVNTNEYEGAES